jgi:glutamate-1-semialdehyde 2,1-aminomutase
MGTPAFIVEKPPARRPVRVRAQGCRLWDSEGAIRIDFDMAGGAMLLGHAHPRVEAAVGDGVGSTERVVGGLKALVPCAEAVRFCAEESQALPAALDGARRATGRRRVAVWRNDGPFGGVDDLAALVVDPLGADPGDLASARRTADAAGAVLVFDEGASSFRVDARGAQGLCGVTPDLAVFGAAIANGRPLGAVAGRADLVRALDADDLPPPQTASLAAAAATLDILAAHPVAPHLRVLGAELQAEVAALTERAGAIRLFSLAGDPSLPTPLFAAPELEGLWLREMSARGLVVVGAHALSAAHDEPEMARLIDAYAALVPAIAAKGMLEALMRRPVRAFSADGRPEGQA